MTNISSKNAARSADNDKEETIEYNDMPKDVCDRCHLNYDTVKIFVRKHLADFSQNLIVDKSNIQQDWSFAEYPEIGTTTLTHPGQTYLIMKGGTI